jgi:hypothetical protein
MQRYVEQLIEDLELVASNPPAHPYIESPPHLNGNIEIAELALSPYKPFSEWTGISEEEFPFIDQITVEEAHNINQAVFKVFAALNIELIDLPAGLPSDLLYLAIMFNWDMPIQFLPNAGYELEFCTFDPDTCPYGEYCECCSDPDHTFFEDDVPGEFDNKGDDELPF